MKQLLEKIEKEIESLSPTIRRAAVTILANPGLVAVYSMRTLAEAANVSPPTMIRLARQFGFSNYQEFRAVFQGTVSGATYAGRASELGKMHNAPGSSNLTVQTALAGERALAVLHDPAFDQTVKSIASAIARARRTFVVASGETFGPAASFHYVSRMALPNIELLNAAGQGLIDGIAFIQKQDVVLAISTAPYARATVEATRYARSIGATVIALTDHPGSPITEGAPYSLLIDTETPHYFPSIIGLVASLEAISSALTVELADSAVNAIAAFEKAIEGANFYWKEDQ